jgi:hypothetical protein
MAVTPVSELTHSPPHTMARLMREQWQFRFFDVSQVKLPDEESSFLSEVWRCILLRAYTFL